MKIILFGAPGAGKGTLGGHIKQVLPNIAHISTGDLFRYNIKEETEIGKKAKEYIDSGKLVPDEVVIGMVENRLDEDDVKEHGFMLDGFPRTVDQAKALDDITEIDLILVIEVPREILLQRILGRMSCPKCGEIYNKFNPKLKPEKEGICDKCGAELSHRSDDNEETLNQRIDTYEQQTLPCVKYFNEQGNNVKIIDGTKTLEMTDDDIKDMLGLN